MWVRLRVFYIHPYNNYRRGHTILDVGGGHGSSWNIGEVNMMKIHCTHEILEKKRENSTIAEGSDRLIVLGKYKDWGLLDKLIKQGSVGCS